MRLHHRHREVFLCFFAIVATLCLQGLLGLKSYVSSTEGGQQQRPIALVDHNDPTYAVDNGALRELHAAAAAGDDLFADERLSDDDGVRLQNDDEEISTQSIAHEEGVERVSPESHGEDDREGMEDEKPFDVHDFYEQPAGSLQGAHVVPPYTILDTLLDVDIWRYTFAVAVYDPPKDRFVALYSKRKKWVKSNGKLFKSLKSVSVILRSQFPERFTPKSPEFAFAISGGDYPHVFADKLPYRQGRAPLLMFGSAFRNPDLYPNMIAMPMPKSLHLYAAEHWALYGEVHNQLKTMAKSYSKNGPFGVWEELIPTVVWRGTDFSYLTSLQSRHKIMKRPQPSQFIKLSPDRKNRRQVAIRKLREHYNSLLPRWKGVVLSEEAKVELNRFGLKNRPSQPWADIAFSSFMSTRKEPTVGSSTYSLWEEVGIAVGKSLDHDELSKYRYQLDIGGGGGTTWTGTMEKLAMPGLLMHHLTPTKDYLHDHMEPWTHYVPVRSDLSDLRERFEWAEMHPNQARHISYRASLLMAYIGSDEGYAELFRKALIEPLSQIIKAYQPVSHTHPGRTWQQVLQSVDGNEFTPVTECRESGCTLIGDDEVLQWIRAGSSTRCNWPVSHPFLLRRICDGEVKQS